MTEDSTTEDQRGLYLYGLTAGTGRSGGVAEALRTVPGISGTPPILFELGGSGVIAEHHAGGEIPRTRRRMLAHTRVLEAALAVAPVLPMRFGLVAGSAEEVAALVAANSDRIDAQIARIDGYVELGLRVRFPREPALEALLADRPDLAAARDRLRGRGPEAHFDRIELGRQVAEALERRRTEAQHLLLSALAPLCADHVLRSPEEDVELLRAEILVDGESQPRLAADVERAARGTNFAPGAEPTVRLVGPVPPFHFVDLALGRPGAEAA